MIEFIQMWWCLESEARERKGKEQRARERARERAQMRNGPIAHPNIRQGLDLWVDKDGQLRARAKSSWISW